MKWRVRRALKVANLWKKKPKEKNQKQEEQNNVKKLFIKHFLGLNSGDICTKEKI